MNWILESKRLKLRRICNSDTAIIANILKNPDNMYAWEHGFSDQEVNEWIERNLLRYSQDGHSFLLAFDKHTDQLIGNVGLITENILGTDYTGIGYILDKQYWGHGYALEAAQVCIDYAFKQLGKDRVIAQIRPNNLRSRRVAEKLGMQIAFEYVKIYKGQEMPHLVYMLKNKSIKN